MVMGARHNKAGHTQCQGHTHEAAPLRLRQGETMGAETRQMSLLSSPPHHSASSGELSFKYVDAIIISYMT